MYLIYCKNIHVHTSYLVGEGVSCAAVFHRWPWPPHPHS